MGHVCRRCLFSHRARSVPTSYLPSNAAAAAFCSHNMAADDGGITTCCCARAARGAHCGPAHTRAGARVTIRVTGDCYSCCPAWHINATTATLYRSTDRRARTHAFDAMQRCLCPGAFSVARFGAEEEGTGQGRAASSRDFTTTC